MTEFRLTRENRHDEHLVQEQIVAFLRRHWCIPIDTDVMDGLKYMAERKSDTLAVKMQKKQARIKYTTIHKARGYTNGQPDLVVLMPSGQVLLVEVKEPRGRQSTEQKIYQMAAENLGFKYVIWRSLADAVEFFKSGAECSNNGGVAVLQSLNSLALLEQRK